MFARRIFIYVVHLRNLAGVDDDTKRPVQILIDWHKHKLLLENIDAYKW